MCAERYNTILNNTHVDYLSVCCTNLLVILFTYIHVMLLLLLLLLLIRASKGYTMKVRIYNGSCPGGSWLGGSWLGLVGWGVVVDWG